MTQTPERERIVGSAARLFYERGIQSVGMDAIRECAGVSLKRLYGEFSSKDDLVVAVLRHRAQIWDDGVAAASTGARTPRERLLAVFDFLDGWFRTEDFRGCGFVNAYGELGAVSPAVAAVTREHKERVRDRLAGLVAELGAPAELADQLVLLVEGAQTTAAISGRPETALHARAAAVTLLDAAVGPDA